MNGEKEQKVFVGEEVEAGRVGYTFEKCDGIIISQRG